MYQVNYSGLKKRESYDEIVAIIEDDQTKVRYPNRVAMQIMNSPYMKQLDYETVMDVQNQQDRLAKQKMKDVVLQEIARQTGTRMFSSEPSTTRAEWLPPCNRRDPSATIRRRWRTA
jgi:hypothetical protein